MPRDQRENAAPTVLSVFDMFKIGVGPSSSHTMGPWRAAHMFVALIAQAGDFDRIDQIEVELFGSLAKTGKGHGTDIAVLMGLAGEDPATCDISGIQTRVVDVADAGYVALRLADVSKIDAVTSRVRDVPFDPTRHIRFRADITHPQHANALTFRAKAGHTRYKVTYFSVGGGFVVPEIATHSTTSKGPTPPTATARHVDRGSCAAAQR